MSSTMLSENAMLSTPSSMPSTATANRIRLPKPSPDLRKVMIDSAGRLVYRPEYEHESLNYKMKATSGAFVGARLNILEDDPLDVFARQKLDALQKSVKKNVKWLRDNVTTGRAKAWDAYSAATRPVMRRYRDIVEMPSRVNERLEKENRAIRSELELTQLRLAEARIRVEEARLLGREYGVSAFAMTIWIFLCALCLLAIAWLFNTFVLDLGSDAFMEYLLRGG